MGEIGEYIGIQFEYNWENGTLTMNQSSVIMKMIDKFDMDSC